MKKSSCARAGARPGSAIRHSSAALATCTVVGLALTVAISGLASNALSARGISISSFSAASNAKAAAAQRKSGEHVQPQQAASTSTQGDANVLHAKGGFDTKVEPQGAPDKAPGSTLGEMSLNKQYHGDLEGAGKGTMLTVASDVKGSAAYVAVERVTGTLNGKTGSFALQHSGTMNRGALHLLITVVPDSGTGQLAGITGTMDIVIAPDGKHSYTFDYTLPPA
jgi:hypothetical protein